MDTQEVVYKRVDGIEIGATVARSENPAGPVLLLIHGGALIWGSRHGMLQNPVVELFFQSGFYAVLSVDYRLAPETKLPDIVEDLEDLYAWVQDGAGGLLAGKDFDICLMGHSAGGYLSQLMAARLPQKPKAVFSFYGYCNIIEDWYTKPSQYYCQQPEISEEEAFSHVHKLPALSESGGDYDRWKFYIYLRQKGLWVDYVTGLTFADTPLSRYDPFCPIALAGRDYPPLFLAHGTHDTDVPFEQSAVMKARMDALGVPCVFHVVQDGEHGFDGNPDWRKSEDSGLMNSEILAFINRYVNCAT